MNTKKTIVLHDYLMHKGGGERLVLMLARALKAPFITAYKEKGAFNPEDFSVKADILGKPISYPGFRYFGIRWRFFFKTKNLKNYDNIIFSANCLMAIHNCRKDAKKIFYCHTPIRNAYDLYPFYMKRMPWWKAFAYFVFVRLIRFVYEFNLKKVDIIVANSKHIQTRIKKYLKRDSIVIYPPIDTNKFQWISQGDYYLSFARIDIVKRVVELAEAFKEMPDKKLIIASTGTEVEKLKEVIKNAPNIEYVGRVEDEKLAELVGNCLATLYIPKDEDFGMSPLEGMAAGKPCLGVSEGGLLETISHKEDGYLLPANPTKQDIKTGVEYLSPQQCLEMKEACIKKSSQFREEIFVEKMKELL